MRELLLILGALIERTNGYANSTSGITWDGQSFETIDGRASGTSTSQSMAISGGIDLADSGAVLLTFS